MSQNQVTTPSKVYYCPRHDCVKVQLADCQWYRPDAICLAQDTCNAQELYVIPREIAPELAHEIELMLKAYKSARSVNKKKFAIRLIEKARGC